MGWAALVVLMLFAQDTSQTTVDIVVENTSGPDANEWIAVGDSATGTQYAIRWRDWHTGNRHPVFWVKQDHSRDRTVPQRSTMTRWRANCPQGTLTMLSTTKYDANGVSLSTLDSESRPFAPPPESIGEGILQTVCPSE
jgi:hypothetical protein